MSSSNKLSTAFELLRDAEDKIATARHLLQSAGDVGLEETTTRTRRQFNVGSTGEHSVVEGIFDGQSMIGADKKIYPIPANYASKSKLVEGDTLKLTIVEDGSFIYKQIGPIDRKTVRGLLARDERGEYRVSVGAKNYRVLLASVTYFKGLPGDEITLVIPSSGSATWAAIENIIKPADDSRLVELAHQAAQQNDDVTATEYDADNERAIPVTNGEDSETQ
ncbi:MAG: hypothetical protein Q8P33_02070 [bacterium]|nr:hypothetical protein [bacterium]